MKYEFEKPKTLSLFNVPVNTDVAPAWVFSKLINEEEKNWACFGRATVWNRACHDIRRFSERTKNSLTACDDGTQWRSELSTREEYGTVLRFEICCISERGLSKISRRPVDWLMVGRAGDIYRVAVWRRLSNIAAYETCHNHSDIRVYEFWTLIDRHIAMADHTAVNVVRVVALCTPVGRPTRRDRAPCSSWMRCNWLPNRRSWQGKKHRGAM